MPCLGFTYNPQVGPIIQVAIFPFGFNPASQVFNQPSPPTQLYNALIDTGASCTCISPKICNDANLPPIGKQPVGGVHGTKAVNQYQFQVAVLFGASSVAPTGAASVNFVMYPVVGFEFAPPGPFDVLLGRDVLCQGHLAMSFDGHGIFCV